MANIQHYRVLLLAMQVQDFKENHEASIPVQAELDKYLTFLELLALWPEENNPFDHARVLAESKVSDKVQRYLLNTVEKVINASTDELLDVAERYINEQQKLINVLNKQVKQFDEIDKNRLERIEELLEEIRVKRAEIEGLEHTNNALISEAADHEHTVEEARLCIDRMAADSNSLHSQLEAANEKISTLTTQVDNLQRSL